VALALSLGGDKLISSMTFGVVVFSLVFQGITLEWFIRRWFRDAEKIKLMKFLRDIYQRKVPNSSFSRQLNRVELRLLTA